MTRIYKAGTAQQFFEVEGVKLDENFFSGGGGWRMLGKFYLISLK